MMLLGAILLVVAFLILASTVARLDLLPAETAAEQGDPFPSEVGAVHDAASNATIKIKAAPGLTTPTLYKDALNRSLDNLEAIASGSGYILDLHGWCGSGGTAWVELWLASASSQAHLKFDTRTVCP